MKQFLETARMLSRKWEWRKFGLLQFVAEKYLYWNDFREHFSSDCQFHTVIFRCFIPVILNLCILCHTVHFVKKQ
jgi:hypothetical protein